MEKWLQKLNNALYKISGLNAVTLRIQLHINKKSGERAIFKDNNLILNDEYIYEEWLQ